MTVSIALRLQGIVYRRRRLRGRIVARISSQTSGQAGQAGLKNALAHVHQPSEMEFVEEVEVHRIMANKFMVDSRVRRAMLALTRDKLGLGRSRLELKLFDAKVALAA